MTTTDDDQAPNPLEAIFRAMQVRRETYEKDTLNSRPFQDGLRYLEGISADPLLAQSYVRLQGTRYSAADDYLMFRFVPHLSESVLAITMNAKEGLQNAARRELRFLLEAAMKLSSRDFHTDARLSNKGSPALLTGESGSKTMLKSFVTSTNLRVRMKPMRPSCRSMAISRYTFTWPFRSFRARSSDRARARMTEWKASPGSIASTALPVRSTTSCLYECSMA